MVTIPATGELLSKPQESAHSQPHITASRRRLQLHSGINVNDAELPEGFIPAQPAKGVDVDVPEHDVLCRQYVEMTQADNVIV